jgi:hypothetical protein
MAHQVPKLQAVNPQGGDKWIDASKLTTGTVIEAILTCGSMLERDADGKVLASLFDELDERWVLSWPLGQTC